MLFLVHYDYPNRRTREDVYYLKKDRPERFYTSMSFYDQGQSYRIFHRVHKPDPLPSPHGCMITPLIIDMIAPTHMRDAPTVFKGPKNISVTTRLRSKKHGERSHQVRGKMDRPSVCVCVCVCVCARARARVCVPYVV